MGDYSKSFEQEVLQRMARIETKIEGISEIRSMAFESNNRSIQNEKDVKEIKDNSKWLKRTIVVAIISSAISVAVGLFEVSLR